MSKQISVKELALVTNSLLIDPERLGELDTEEKYQAFITDLAKLLCDHCGGEVKYAASKPDGEAWFVGIHANDSLPDDGGIWKACDPEGTFFQGYDKAECFEHGHWYLRSEDRALFIVPDDRHGLAETYGPDDETLTALDNQYRYLEGRTNDPNWFDSVDTNIVQTCLDLTFIHPWQRRFDPEAGWYVA